jgi:hypothetical protein
MTVSSPPGLETESLALQLVRALYDSTDGLAQQWRMLEEFPGMTAEAIELAVARGWMIVEAGHSICLTNAGRRLVESR